MRKPSGDGPRSKRRLLLKTLKRTRTSDGLRNRRKMSQPSKKKRRISLNRKRAKRIGAGLKKKNLKMPSRSSKRLLPSKKCSQLGGGLSRKRQISKRMMALTISQTETKESNLRGVSSGASQSLLLRRKKPNLQMKTALTILKKASSSRPNPPSPP